MIDKPLSFGYWIRRRRKALDLTQEALAHRVGCSLGAVRKLESDDRRPSPEMAARLAQMLELAADERAAFLKAARAELAPDHLAAPTASVNLLRQPLTIGHGSFPVAATPLIGRTAEVAAVCAALEQPEVRLLTLTGPGGTGKTRLALAVATASEDGFRDGACFVDLAPIRDPNLVLPTIAATLGLADQREQSHLALLQTYMRGKQLMLLLDNFEQVVAAAPLVDVLLRAAPLLKLLVTSRSVLGVYGEHVVEIPPLELPQQVDQRSGGSQVGQVAQVAAVRLFVERAVATQATFVLNDRNVEAVVAICHRVDGLPLAIELAAARTRLLPPPLLLQRLGRRLPLLTGGARTLPARQQTLRTTIEWSYELLTRDQQTLFRQLAVFAGGCTLEAAEAVCHADDAPVDMLDGMQALIDQSLVRVLDANASEPRYMMLETIREYALECLATRHELAETSRRHAAYYLGVAETAEPHLRSVEQVVWFERLEREHDNLRAALDWNIANGEIQAALRMGAALAWFWYRRGHQPEAQERFRTILTSAGVDVEHVDVSQLPRSRALAQVLLGASQCFGSDTWHPDAVISSLAARLTASIRLFRELGDARELGIALAFRSLYRWADDEDVIIASRTESVELLRRCDDAWAAALAHLCASDVAIHLRDYTAAGVHVEEGVRLFRNLGDRWGVAFALSRLGGLGSAQGDSSREIHAYEESLVVRQEANDQVGIAEVLDQLAGALRWQGTYERAAAVYEECIALVRELGLETALAAALHGRGYVALWQGQAAEATRLITESLRLFRAIGHGNGIGWCFHVLAGVAGLAEVPCARRAARLLGAASTLTIPVTFWPSGPRAEYERVVTAARTQLDETAWQAAWAEGRAMTVEQAIAYALNETADPS